MGWLLVRVVQKLVVLLGFFSITISRVYRSEKEKISSKRLFSEWEMPCDDRDLKLIAPLLWADRKVNNNSNNHLLPLKHVEDSSIGPHQMLLTIYTGLPKLDIRLLEKLLPGLMSLSFCCNIQMVWNNMKVWIHPALYHDGSMVSCGGVMVSAIFCCHT